LLIISWRVFLKASPLLNVNLVMGDDPIQNAVGPFRLM